MPAVAAAVVSPSFSSPPGCYMRFHAFARSSANAIAMEPLTGPAALGKRTMHDRPRGSRGLARGRSLRWDRAGDPVRLEAVDELGRTAQGDEMTARDLIRRDRQSLAGDASLEVCREESVVATDENPRRHIGPRVEGPGLRHGRPRLLRLAPPEGLVTDLRRDIVEVD